MYFFRTRWASQFDNVTFLGEMRRDRRTSCPWPSEAIISHLLFRFRFRRGGSRKRNRSPIHSFYFYEVRGGSFVLSFIFIYYYFTSLFCLFLIPSDATPLKSEFLENFSLLTTSRPAWGTHIMTMIGLLEKTSKKVNFVCTEEKREMSNPIVWLPVMVVWRLCMRKLSGTTIAATLTFPKRNRPYRSWLYTYKT